MYFSFAEFAGKDSALDLFAKIWLGLVALYLHTNYHLTIASISAIFFVLYYIEIVLFIVSDYRKFREGPVEQEFSTKISIEME